MNQPQTSDAVFCVVVNNGQERISVIQQQFTLPEDHFIGTRLESRVAKQQANEQMRMSMQYQVTFDFNQSISSELQDTLKMFTNVFLPRLKDKPVQLRAELANLEHIRSCSEEC